MTERAKGLVLVAAGIDAANYTKARRLTLAQLAALQAGEVEDAELAMAKGTLLSSLLSLRDAPHGVIDFALDRTIHGIPADLDSLLAQLAAVTVKDVARAAAPRSSSTRCSCFGNREAMAKKKKDLQRLGDGPSRSDARRGGAPQGLPVRPHRVRGAQAALHEVVCDGCDALRLDGYAAGQARAARRHCPLPRAQGVRDAGTATRSTCSRRAARPRTRSRRSRRRATCSGRASTTRATCGRCSTWCSICT